MYKLFPKRHTHVIPMFIILPQKEAEVNTYGKILFMKKFKINEEDQEMASRLDDLAVYEEFKTTLAPKLRNLLLEGKSPDDIYKEASSYVAARAVTIALNEQDSGRALTAIKEILDRSAGKAVERQEISHKYENLSDEELDQRLAALTAESKDEDHTSH